MRFVMDGDLFELTSDQVRSSLLLHRPDVIKTHWVEVDGRRWPVKQALAIATGTKKKQFVSRTARRHMRKLGFMTSDDAERGVTSLIVVRDGRQDFSLATLPTLDRVALSLSFTWRDAGQVILDGSGLPAFPRLPHTPGLYRFEFHGLEDGGERAVYIGESVDLARRGSNYRNAKTERSRQRTSRRIHKELVKHLGAGGRIDFAVTVDVTLDAAGDPIDLRRKSARRLAENAAVLLAQMNGDSHVLNIDADLGGAN